MEKKKESDKFIKWLYRVIEETYKDDDYLKGLFRTAYETGWDDALYSQWVGVDLMLPKLNQTVIVLTKNKKVAISFIYQPTDRLGNSLGKPCWKGSKSFVDSIIAWMPVPSCLSILKANIKVYKDK